MFNSSFIGTSCQGWFMIQITRVFLWIDFPSGDYQIWMNSFHHWFQHVNISYLIVAGDGISVTSADGRDGN